MSRHRHKKLPGGGRNLRLADQIQKDLAEMIQRELDVSRAGLITLTSVALSPDYAHARVFFTVIGASPEVATQTLNEKAGWFHSLLFKQLHIHTVPTLVFLHDDQLSKGVAMSRLIDTANTPGVLADSVAAGLPDVSIEPPVRGSVPDEPEPDPDDQRG